MQSRPSPMHELTSLPARLPGQGIHHQIARPAWEGYYASRVLSHFNSLGH